MNHCALDEIKNLIYVSVISADNDEFGLSEEDKQEIIYRKELTGGTDWGWVLEPIKNLKQRDILVQLLEE